MECKKRIIACVMCCLCAIFAMSHNASALNNQLLGDDWILYRHTAGNPMCAQNSTAPEARRQSVSSPWNLNNGEFSYWSCADSNNSAISAIKGDVIVVEINTDYELSPYWYNTSARYLFSSYSRNIQTIYYYTDGFNYSVEFGWTYNSEINGANNTLFRIQSINFYRKSGGAPSYEGALNTINNSINNLNNSVNDVKDAIENQNKEERQETQDAIDHAQSGADDAQADSETATSSLLSVITGFFGAMANLNPSNCKFDSHLPFLSGSGQIDLCTVPAPAIVQTIGSLILIGLMVPFAIHMYNRFISITGSFQK